MSYEHLIIFFERQSKLDSVYLKGDQVLNGVRYKSGVSSAREVKKRRE